VLAIQHTTKSLTGTAVPPPAGVTYEIITSLGGNTGASVLLGRQ
jgi:hypothetical protein